jgi:hypothetical protein
MIISENVRTETRHHAGRWEYVKVSRNTGRVLRVVFCAPDAEQMRLQAQGADRYYASLKEPA